jgi:glycosyltransferase involved in cell wall biosynthesis
MNLRAENQCLSGCAVEAWQRELTIVVPAYNEEQGIEPVLRELRVRFPEAAIIVVDDASSDATADKARSVAGVRIVVHSHNCGYGGALKTGMVLAETRYIAWFDADGEHRVEDLATIVERLHTDQLIAVIGQRPQERPFAVRTVGKWLIRFLARSMKMGAEADMNCGLRAFHRDVICRYLHVLPDGFSASLTSLVIMLENRYPTAFQSVQTSPRVGKSKVRLRDGFSTLALVIRIVMLFAPLRIFLRGGLAIAGAGIAYSVVLALVLRQGVPVAGALTILSGLLFMAVGLIADQISQLRLIQLASLTSLPFRPIKADWKPQEPDVAPFGRR